MKKNLIFIKPSLTWLSLLLPFFIFSCNQKQSKIGNVNHQVSSKAINSFSVEDSLNKYSKADSMLLVYDSTGAVLFIGKANNINFGIWAVTDSLLKFYQIYDNEWRLLDSMEYKLTLSFVDRIDLNGDRKNDVKVSCISGSAGNTENVVFLFHPENRLFKHNEYYDLPNVEFDSVNNFIRSSWFAGVVHCQAKQKYRIEGDSLKLDLDASYCPDEKTEGKTGTLEVSQIINGKERIIKRVKGKSEKVWDRFEQVLWDSRSKDD